MSELLVFQEFNSKEEADKIAVILNEGGVDVIINSSKAGLLDSNFIGTTYEAAYQLKMLGDDFSKARQILSEKFEVSIEEVDKNYMLLSFTNEELSEVIAKPDEWGFYNYNIAVALLKQRGQEVSKDTKVQLNEKRMKKLSEPKSISLFWIFVGYLIAIVNSIAFYYGYQNYLDRNAEDGIWLLPGFLGFIIGAVLIYSKTTLPDGTRIFTNKKEIRKHGPVILWANVISWLMNLVLEIGFVIEYYN